MKISMAMKKVLVNMANDLRPSYGFHGVGANGGLNGTLAELSRRGFVRHSKSGGYELTQKGRDTADKFKDKRDVTDA